MSCACGCSRWVAKKCCRQPLTRDTRSQSFDTAGALPDGRTRTHSASITRSASLNLEAPSFEVIVHTPVAAVAVLVVAIVRQSEFCVPAILLSMCHTHSHCCDGRPGAELHSRVVVAQHLPPNRFAPCQSRSRVSIQFRWRLLFRFGPSSAKLALVSIRRNKRFVQFSLRETAVACKQINCARTNKQHMRRAYPNRTPPPFSQNHPQRCLAAPGSAALSGATVFMWFCTRVSVCVCLCLWMNVCVRGLVSASRVHCECTNTHRDTHTNSASLPRC